MKLTGASRKVWEVEEESFAGGGQSKVHKTLDGSYAVKIAKPGSEAWIRKEVLVLVDRHGRHPALKDVVVEPVDWGELPRPFLVMRYYPSTLEKWLEKKKVEDRLWAAEREYAARAPVNGKDSHPMYSGGVATLGRRRNRERRLFVATATC